VTVWTALSLSALALWLVILVLPWRPWRTAESLDGPDDPTYVDLSDVTVLIPARNESPVIAATLVALAAQGRGLKVVVVDDQSADGTAGCARGAGLSDLTVLPGQPLPPGWTGKLWAQEQGRRLVGTRLTLLLDADIKLAPGIVAALRRKIDVEGYSLVSLMAAPPISSVWERLLLPAYIYFFKLLYPFALSNTQSRFVATAAGGCVLLETRVLDRVGGFAAIQGELIDDCALARRARQAGFLTWIGLTHDAVMLRHQDLAQVWNMVARTAFTQLRYSLPWLCLCTLLLVLAYGVPAAGTLTAPGTARYLAAAAYGVMMATYLPTLRYYGLPWPWALALPVTGLLYLAMTWTSALRYWGGDRSRWKGRVYGRLPESET
jgi:hopene-associated glycosyltransferase HpnB